MNTRAPDPLEQAESEDKRLRQSYVCVTGGEDRGIDALGICVAVLKVLDEDERAAVLRYLGSRFSPVS